jgi:outer membrane lipoprotein-sorting protein
LKRVGKIWICILFSLAAFGLHSQSEENGPRAVSIIETYQEKTNFPEYGLTLRFTLVQKREAQSDRVIRLKIYRRDREQAYTIIFHYPESEEGKGYLQRGEDLFLYLPSTREFVYRNRREDVGSTDVRTDFFGGKNLLERYTASYAGEEEVNNWPTRKVRLEAKTIDVTFPLQTWYFRSSDGLPVKVENFSASEQLARTYYIVSYRTLPQNNYIFTRLVAVNHIKNNRKTFINIENVSAGDIPDYVFTKEFLEEQAR